LKSARCNAGDIRVFRVFGDRQRELFDRFVPLLGDFGFHSFFENFLPSPIAKRRSAKASKDEQNGKRKTERKLIFSYFCMIWINQN
jgi:hypothetical protein